MTAGDVVDLTRFREGHKGCVCPAENGVWRVDPKTHARSMVDFNHDADCAYRQRIASGLAAQLAKVAAAQEEGDRPFVADATNGHSRPGGFVTVCLSDVVPERVTWLWDGRIPLGKVIVLDGLPDLGKSTITTDLAARVTVGAPMPDGAPGLTAPADVVMFTAEDGLADTVRPRLDAAGGDPARAHVVRATTRVDDNGEMTEQFPELPADLDHLGSLVERTSARLVIVDVLMAYLGAHVNAYRDQDMRRVLGPMSAVAERLGCAVILLRHPPKAGSTDPVLNGGGSIGIIGAARVGLIVGYDPDEAGVEPNQRRRLLAVGKCNIAPKAATLAYRLVNDPERDVAKVLWEGTTHHRAEDVLTGADERAEQREMDAALADFLLHNDSDVPCGATAEGVRKFGNVNGWSPDQLRRSLRRFGGVIERRGFQGGSVWLHPNARPGSHWWRVPTDGDGHTNATDGTTNGAPQSPQSLQSSGEPQSGNATTNGATCGAPGCANGHDGRGLCPRHWNARLRGRGKDVDEGGGVLPLGRNTPASSLSRGSGGAFLPGEDTPPTICQVADCGLTHDGSGLCWRHRIIPEPEGDDWIET